MHLFIKDEPYFIIYLFYFQVIESGTPQDLLTDQHSFFNAMIAAQTVKTPSP